MFHQLVAKALSLQIWSTGVETLPSFDCHWLQDPLECYKNTEWDDYWDDASIFDCICYLRGNHSLKIPAEWRPHLIA